jgi:hypothetical protein
MGTAKGAVRAPLFLSPPERSMKKLGTWIKQGLPKKQRKQNGTTFE